MHFFRFQEWYESPTMKEKNVQFVDLMESYTRNLGKGNFTYINDWAGFNIPGHQIFDRFKEGISDSNRYDALMLSLATFVRAKEGSESFYIIGTSDDDPDKNATFNHELSHSLFYANPSYKEKMTKYVEALPKNVKAKIFDALKKWGYDEKFFIDETQAYLSTGLQSPIDISMVREQQAKFKRLFNIASKGMKKRAEQSIKIKLSKKTVKKSKKTIKKSSK